MLKANAKELLKLIAEYLWLLLYWAVWLYITHTGQIGMGESFISGILLLILMELRSKKSK